MAGRIYASLIQASNDLNYPYPEHNPLTKTGKKVMRNMRKQYGSEAKAEEVFYATSNKKKLGKRWHR